MQRTIYDVVPGTLSSYFSPGNKKELGAIQPPADAFPVIQVDFFGPKREIMPTGTPRQFKSQGRGSPSNGIKVIPMSVYRTYRILYL